jgi:hypothetical protein
MKRFAALLLVSGLFAPAAAEAMCGGMMPRVRPKLPPQELIAETARARIVNKSSKVVLTRDDQLTAITMANDFKGEASEFAMVVPVPVVIKAEQVSVLEPGVFTALEDATAPRLTEIYEPDPCPHEELARSFGRAESVAPQAKSAPRGGGGPRASDFGVKVESHFVQGEYEIAVLAATDAKKLVEWLNLFHYGLPEGTEAMFQSYLAQGMRFFVARVNLKDKSKLGFGYLRPIQVRYQTPKFMLPIRMGMLNADGPQELMVFALTRVGRVEPLNYRSAELPTGLELPPYIKGDFNGFYRAFFDEQTRKVDTSAVFTEWAGTARELQGGARGPQLEDPFGRPMGSGATVTSADLKRLGAAWVADEADPGTVVTRLHFKYDRAHFPEDLTLQETGDRQRRAVGFTVRHPFLGPARCEAARAYQATLATRFDQEAVRLASLTGWDVNEVRQRQPQVKFPAAAPPSEQTPTPAAPKKNSWWDRLFGSDPTPIR